MRKTTLSLACLHIPIILVLMTIEKCKPYERPHNALIDITFAALLYL